MVDGGVWKGGGEASGGAGPDGDGVLGAGARWLGVGVARRTMEGRGSHVSEGFGVAVPGGEIRGERWQGDGPAVVLAHAGVADRRSWAELAACVGHRAALVAYDRRGFGETPPSDAPYTHVADLLAVLDALDVEDAWLVGSSAGGGLALDVAVAAPERVAGLVLLAPAVRAAPEPVLDPATELLADLIDAAAEAGDLEEVNRLETWLWLDGPRGPEGRVGGARRGLVLDMNGLVLAHGVADTDGASDLDVWGRLGEVEQEAVVACGGLDVPFVVSRSRQVAELLPRGRYVELVGMAHLPYLEEPAVVADLVVDAVGRR